MLPDLANEKDFTPNAQKEQDQQLFVKFELRTKPDKAETAKRGTQCFKEVTYIDIRVPGQKDNICRPMHEGDKQRFPRHYEAFLSRTGDVELDGTPLREWTGVTRSNAEELAFVNIMTVEQLATTADVQISKFLGGFKLRDMAKDYVEQMKSEKPFKEIKLENEELRKMNRDQNETIANLVVSMQALEAKLSPKKEVAAPVEEVKAKKGK
tara:strand:+ start:7103 stop:7732 length:630 start_codon:yes stop_codon:yes gene_type:complete